jgi:hypothetical protein
MNIGAVELEDLRRWRLEEEEEVQEEEEEEEADKVTDLSLPVGSRVLSVVEDNADGVAGGDVCCDREADKSRRKKRIRK